jgi:RNA polymerase sigma factor FliA
MMNTAIDVAANPYAKQRASSEIDAIVKAHGRLVRRIAWHVHSGMSSMIGVEDLIQIGLIALVEAARGFEDRGAPFAPYAATRIRGSMIDALRRDAHIGRQGIANRKRLSITRRALENKLCRGATDTEMADAMDVDLPTFHALESSSCALQFDALDQVYSDSSAWFIDLGQTPEDALIENQVEQHLTKAIATLEPRAAMVLQLYFKEGLNLSEIAACLNVSAPRVCQIKKEALDQVRLLLSDIIDQ